MNEKVKTGIRMVGHILEHHSTTGVFARTKEGAPVLAHNPSATYWCALGAESLVEYALKFNSAESSYLNQITSVIMGSPCRGLKWDSISYEKRLAYARKLQEFDYE